MVDNSDYKICPSYPRFFVLPAGLTHAEIEAIAKHRSSGRLPALVFSYENSAGKRVNLFRSSQPKGGISDKPNVEDIKLIRLMAT